MPQLDFMILTSQFNLIAIFILGYILFIKYLLPNATLVLKSYSKSLIKKFTIFSKASTFLKTNFFTYDSTLFNVGNLSVMLKFYSMNNSTNFSMILVKKCLKI